MMTHDHNSDLSEDHDDENKEGHHGHDAMPVIVSIQIL